jgi:hypothetical protein
MSFGDLYSVPTGQGNPPGLPPVDLPQTPAPLRRPLQITVGAPAPKDDPWAGSGVVFRSADDEAKTAQQPSGDPWADSGVKFVSPEDEAATAKNHRDVSMGEAFARSAGTGATFGLEPAIEGVNEAGRSTFARIDASMPPEVQEKLRKHGHESTLANLIAGLGALGYEHLIAPALGITSGDQATQDYRRGRDEAQEALEAGREQHPVASFAGEMAGALAVPVPGLAAAAAPARIARGAAAGAAGGAAYGAGTAISKGKDTGGIVKDTLIGGALGAPTGAAFAGVLGPRAATAASPGERAAQTARDLGAPLPRGVASDSRAVQATTAKLRQVPFAGERIGHAVENTQEAAGERIGDIAGQMAGGATDRAAAGATVRPSLRGVVNANRQTIDAGYDAVRNQIDRGRHFVLPRTQRVLQDIRAARTAAGWPNPSQGLEQFENVARDATFDGAHRARVDAREAGNALVPHPGYNAADFNRLTRAMTADLREMVANSALPRGAQRFGIIGPASPAERAAAVQAFDQAETEFGRLAEQNGVLQKLIDAKGEGAIATLLGAAKEKGGDLRLLAQLRGSMPPADFQQVGGVLLAELGHNSATGRFSLSQFVTNWDKVSDRAKGILFSPQHLRNIEDIAGMGAHIKSALRESSTSHSAGLLVLLDVAKDAALLGADIASGGLGAGSAIGAGTTAGVWMLARWLGNPATASSMAAWSRARVGVLNHPTPARLAAFNIATRNLANNLGVPLESLTKRLAAPVIGGRSEDEEPKVERPRGEAPDRNKVNRQEGHAP